MRAQIRVRIGLHLFKLRSSYIFSDSPQNTLYASFRLDRPNSNCFG